MADTSELRMNVAALKRVDPYVRDILDTATYVALYSFNGEDNEWKKTDIEGALFVYSRSGHPKNSILIMNRLNTSNLVEPVVQGLDLQVTEPFLLYRTSQCRIYGIWFYNKDECVRISLLLDKLVNEVVRNQITAIKSPAVSATNLDIFQMLSKAQEEFKKNVPRAPDVTSQSVMDFFAKASAGSKGEPLIQKLMTNPVHRVENIEKQVRASTPPTIEKDEQNISLLENSFTRLRSSPDVQIRQQATAPALMPPTMFTSATARLESSVEPLTRNQFLQAFTYLLRNDPDFVNKLHEAYVKSFSNLIT